MAKYEIEIPNRYVEKRGIQRITVVEPCTNGNSTYVVAAKEIPEPRPSYSRQTVLREEWQPKFNASCVFLHVVEIEEACFYINTCAYSEEIKRAIVGTTFPKDYRHIIFTPTVELAEEIKSIRNGNWLPKKNDEVFACSRANLETFFRNGKHSEVYRFTAGKDFDGEAGYYDRIFFASEKQRAAFIERQRKEKENPYHPYSCKEQFDSFIIDADSVSEKNKPKEEKKEDGQNGDCLKSDGEFLRWEPSRNGKFIVPIKFDFQLGAYEVYVDEDGFLKVR